MNRTSPVGRLAAAVAVLALLGFAPRALGEEGRGANPADNLTKFELLPKLTVIEDENGVSIATLTLKYDWAIRGT